MQRVASLESENQGNVPQIVAADGTPTILPLPSDYFDYIFGTSTGGLDFLGLMFHEEC
jgi:hypothetical protein